MGTPSLTTNSQALPKRLILGFVALASAAVVAAAGIAGATGNNSGQVGYGGGNNNTVDTRIDLEVNGNNNVINIVLNYVFG